jgi:hypothetical protein
MKHEEFENQMFSHVNKKCQMKELDRQEIARAAQEEYQYICKCKKVNAIIGIIVWTVCFATIIFAVSVLSWLSKIPALVAIPAIAFIGYVVGVNVNTLQNRIKN